MIEGLRPIKRITKNNAPTKPDEIIVEAETILAGMPKRPPIAHGGNQAFYSPSEDRVQMPPKKAFDKTQEYYSVLFHELVHSTGHKSRVGREFKGRSGDKDYAFEELIAEIGASYLCGVSGIEYYTINNSAAYIKGWSTKLGDILSADEKFFFRAVIAATRAAKYIIAESVEKEGKKQIKSPVKPVKKK